MFVSKECYKACIYARLSKDDGDKPESDSIGNQKALIRDFLKSRPEIRVVSEQVDDGYSGVNFERPGFKAMMEDIRAGKVDCVIVKDLSRFGRNYIEAGNYIERVFPFIGVRFIAINDSYDSIDQNQSDSLIIPFKNLINDAYCKDISVKIRSQLEIKRKKGQFIGAFAAYGYLKDEEDHNKLLVDTYASEIVRAIFKWKIQGMSQGRIANKLNMQGVLCPMEYKLSLGMKVQTNFRVHKKALWSSKTVTRILTNEIYTGVLVQGKVGTPNYKIKKIMPRDEADWIRVEGVIPVIIDRDMFDSVQMILAKDIRIAPEEDVVYPLSGFVKCADCGQNMVRKSYNAGGKAYSYFICSTRKAGKGCSTHSISEEKLTDVVLQMVSKQIDSVCEMEKMLDIVDSFPEKQANVFNYDAQVVRLKEEIERNKSFKLKLYENLQEGLIGQDEYFLFKKSYAAKIAEAEAAIRAIEDEREQAVSRNRDSLSWMETFKKYRNITSVNRSMVVDLIRQVNVFEGGRTEVVFRHADEAEKVVKMLEDYGRQAV